MIQIELKKLENRARIDQKMSEEFKTKAKDTTTVTTAGGDKITKGGIDWLKVQPARDSSDYESTDDSGNDSSDDEAVIAMEERKEEDEKAQAAFAKPKGIYTFKLHCE